MFVHGHVRAWRCGVTVAIVLLTYTIAILLWASYVYNLQLRALLQALVRVLLPPPQ